MVLTDFGPVGSVKAKKHVPTTRLITIEVQFLTGNVGT